jgi:hypothetical protein
MGARLRLPGPIDKAGGPHDIALQGFLSRERSEVKRRCGVCVLLAVVPTAMLALVQADLAGVTWGERFEVASGGGYRGPWHMNESEYDYVDDPTVASAFPGRGAQSMPGFPRPDIIPGGAMPVDVSGTLRQALASLITEKARIERQIMGLRQALGAGAGAGADGGRPTGRRARPRRVRRRMSPAERKAVSARMKALWAKREGGASKGRTKKG